MVVMPGKNWPSQHGFPTPDSTPETSACRTFSVPASAEWLGALMDAVMPLREEWAWYKWGSMTEEETAAAWNEIILQAYADAEDGVGACAAPAETPYWDDGTDVEENMPAADQPWYGFVEDALAPPDGLTWNENISLWLFTGLVALSAAPAAAIFFRPLAVKFAVTLKSGDVIEAIRIVVDGIDQGTHNTSGTDGDIMNIPVYGDSALTEHTMYVIKVA